MLLRNITNKRLTKFYILKVLTKGYFSNGYKYEPVAYYDNENYFRGQAIFETEKEALDYREKYLERINKRNEKNGRGHKISTELQVFMQDKFPTSVYTHSYYHFKSDGSE